MMRALVIVLALWGAAPAHAGRFSAAILRRPGTTTTTTGATSTTTTSTSTSTTTTLAFIIDDFERGSLGANWTTVYGAGCSIKASSIGSSPGNFVNGGCTYNAFSPATVSYSCAQLAGSDTGDGSSFSVCLGMDAPAYGVCCGVDWESGGDWFAYSPTDGSLDGDVTPTFNAGDFIGIERYAGGSTYRCFRSTDGTTWTALGAGNFTDSTQADPGTSGMDTSTFTASNKGFEVWEGGDGTLPTGRACGGVSTTTTAPTTTTATATTSTSTSSTTTTTAVPLITCTLLTSGSDATDASTYTTASISPGANRLILVALVNAKSGTANNATSVTGNGFTYTEVDPINVSAFVASDNRRLTLWRAMGASPSTGAITFSGFGVNQTSAAWSVIECAGVRTSGSLGANAVVQSAKSADNPSNATSLSITLAAFANADSATLGFFVSDSATALTPGSGFTALDDTTGGDATCHLLTEWRGTNDTTVDVSAGGSVQLGGFALEVRTP